MKNKLIIFIIIFFTSSSFAAFNQKESAELNAINLASQRKVDNTLKTLNQSIDVVINDFPEKKSLILQLQAKWEKMIIAKCQLETVDSTGRDAEIAARNHCLAKEYQHETDYFTTMLMFP